MKFFALKIAYNGARFSGFAPQRTDGIASVSECLGQALARLGIDSPIIGAGRTDKGVHALGMVVRICLADEQAAHWDSARLYSLLSPKLSADIFLRAVWEVDSSFHPRFSATARRYMYIFTPHTPLPFHASFVSKELIGDTTLLRECLRLCIGEHDFALFCKSGSNPKSTIRTIDSAHLLIRHYPAQPSVYAKPYYIVRLSGNAFLRSQVRLLLGAALAVSRGVISLADFSSQLQAKSRSYSIPVSAQGLYLDKVWYPQLSAIY